MKQTIALAQAINAMPRHYIGVYSGDDAVIFGNKDVKELGGFHDITAIYKRGKLSITDRDKPKEKPLSYDWFFIAGFKDYGDSIDIFLMDGSVLALIGYPL